MDCNGLVFKVGDNYKILNRDADSILIEKFGDDNNPYFVSAEFLKKISEFIPDEQPFNTTAQKGLNTDKSKAVYSCCDGMCKKVMDEIGVLRIVDEAEKWDAKLWFTSLGVLSKAMVYFLNQKKFLRIRHN